MSIKEKPLIDAVQRLGALPGFLFSHPTIAGFFAMFMCAVFGAVFVLFWTLHGKALEVYEAVRLGAYFALAFGGAIMIGAVIGSGIGDLNYRLQFLLGGVLAIAFLTGADFLTVDYLRVYLVDKGYLICTSQAMGCD